MAKIQLTPELEKLIEENIFKYIWARAKGYVEAINKGLSYGTSLDKLKPQKLKSEVSLLYSGCQQVLEYKGLTPETAFEGLGIPGFYKFVDLFNCKVIKQALVKKGDDLFLDRMTIEHRTSAETIELYNKVIIDDEYNNIGQ